LCEFPNTVIALEVDPRLVEYLNETLTCSNLDLRHCRCFALCIRHTSRPNRRRRQSAVLHFDATLVRLARSKNRISRMVLMLQAEVAERIIARRIPMATAFSPSSRNIALSQDCLSRFKKLFSPQTRRRFGHHHIAYATPSRRFTIH
jgi:Dimethyladenosine transferase (rRNA methylation)